MIFFTMGTWTTLNLNQQQFCKIIGPNTNNALCHVRGVKRGAQGLTQHNQMHRAM